MATDCSSRRFDFQGTGGRRCEARFDGGTLCSDGGALLLSEVERQRGILRRFAACFVDHRDQRLVEHSVEEMIRQRVYGVTLGYEDLCDHDELRKDPLLAVLAGKRDPTGTDRRQAVNRGKPLAGKSTLHRLEWGESKKAKGDRYRRIEPDGDAVDRLFVDLFVGSHRRAPRRLILDLDATDNPIHGEQEGRFFHGYYGCYCYLPLYIFCGTHLLCARLRRSDIDASKGCVDELSRIVAQLRSHWPQVEIWIRADSGFAREDLMSWCESNRVDFVLGLARNPRLEKALDGAMDRAEEICARTGKPARSDPTLVFLYRLRRVYFSLANHHPRQALFAHAYDRLQRAGPRTR